MSAVVPTVRDGLLALVVGLRLVELIWASHNTRRLLANGAREHGQGHYPLIVAFHAAWLAALILLVPRHASAQPLLLAAFLALQAARGWVLATLGSRWTTRVIVPDAPPIARGPYRWLRHPNYLIVALEIPLLPLVFGAWDMAIGFGIVNLALLAWRIRVETDAWARNPASALREPR